MFVAQGVLLEKESGLVTRMGHGIRKRPYMKAASATIKTMVYLLGRGQSLGSMSEDGLPSRKRLHRDIDCTFFSFSGGGGVASLLDIVICRSLPEELCCCLLIIDKVDMF